MNKLILIIFFPIACFSQSSFDTAENFFLQKEYKAAEKELVKFVSQNPNHLDGIELLGDTYSHQEKWSSAVDVYEKLIKAQSETANYQYKYGGAIAMKALGLNKVSAMFIIGDAKAAFLKAAQLDKRHIDTRWALVELYMQLPGFLGGSKSNSLKFANQLEDLSKVDGYLSKGYIYEYDDEPELAETYYRMAIKEGGSLTCYNKLTNLYETQNQPEKALVTIEEAQIHHQRNALHYQIGKVSGEYNLQLDKGERCLLTYLENYSAKDGVPKAWAYYRLAQIYKHQGLKDDGIKYIDMAISELPKIDVFKLEKTALQKL